MMKKALALISGGLDSLLAAKIILLQNIRVEGIYFFTGFIPLKSTCEDKLEIISNELNIPIHKIDFSYEYKSVVLNPKHGYGSKHVNPCLDCKILMLKKSFEFAKQNGFDFLITGEVIGQRPMTQKRNTMNIVTKESGTKDILLRPLCAKCLSPTLPERENWINRNKLYNLNGRSRAPQITLAKELKLEYFPAPANDCCSLIDPNFAKRWIDFKKHNNDYELDDISLLKVGRHIRINDRFKMIIGRNECDNIFLEKYKNRFILMYATDFIGPITLLTENPNEEDIKIAASITAKFGRGKNQSEVLVKIEKLNNTEENILVKPKEINKDFYV